jgi:hypothetical protein
MFSDTVNACILPQTPVTTRSIVFNGCRLQGFARLEVVSVETGLCHARIIQKRELKANDEVRGKFVTDLRKKTAVRQDDGGMRLGKQPSCEDWPL